MAEIFLSYRRTDSSSATGRLADRLEAVFGAARVFRDHDSIGAGDDFAEAIRRAIEVSAVLVVVIGPQWLAAALADGRRRLDDPHDWVRLEIEAALAADVGIVPVLVEDATMPGEAQLPPSLAALARCQAIELSETRWRYDTDRLVEALQSRYAIEAQGVAPGEARSEATQPSAAARLALDVLDLGTHPTRLIARRQTGRALDHWRAFLFLAGSLLAGNLMLLIGTGVQPGGGGVVPTLAWLASGELLGLLLVALLAVPLAIGWRIAGARVEYRRVTLVGAYLFSGAWIGFCAGVLVFGLGVQFVDAGVFDRAVALLAGRDGAVPATPAARAAAVAAQLGPAMHGPATALFAVALVVWAIAAGWTIVAWGAFRQALGGGRGQAALATAVWLVLVGAVGVVAARAAA